jgi:hypothetical protein
MTVNMSDAELVAFNADIHQRAEATMRAARATMTPEKAAEDEFMIAAIEHNQRKTIGVPTDQCTPSQSYEDVMQSAERQVYVARRAEEIRKERESK